MTLDKIIITNLPAFYKIALFNRITDSMDILVIFTGNDAEIRNKDFFTGEMKFQALYLQSGSSVSKALQILRILRKNEYRKLILGGWDEILLWAAAFYSPRHKNELILESSYLESKSTGIMKIIKKTFLNRISNVYASGASQIKLLNTLAYSGNKVRTGGVGLFNRVSQPSFKEKHEITKFMYVGRFSEEKNLQFILNYFNKHKNLQLTLVGYGPQENVLRTMAGNNIVFLGQVQNKDMHSYYAQNDVLILASLHDVWGLVIEEALNNGLPVLLSDRVGSAEEWFEKGVALLFDPYSEQSLDKAVTKIINPKNYKYLSKNVSELDFEEIEDRQVQAYIN